MKRPILIAVAGAAVLVVALVFAFLTLEGKREAPPAPATPEVSDTDTDTAPDAGAEVASAPDAPADGTTSLPTAAPGGPKPTFDIVRIDPEGNAVMAGRASPNAEIRILDGGRQIGRVTADERGEWVFVPDQAMPTGNRELTLSMIDRDGLETQSDDVVVLIVPEDDRGHTIALKTDRRGGASTILQGSPSLPGDGSLTLDTVDYDEAGKLIVTGHGKPKAVVQFYLDGAFGGRVTVPENGRWVLEPDSLAEKGVHVVRADMMAPDGTVVARVELPFNRIEMPGMPDGVRVVVQPGNSLWLLARKAYGEGLAYTVIYDANQGQITNPDLIYPGQVFIVPKGSSNPAAAPQDR